MVTLKDQENDEIKRLSTKNNCEPVIVPHNPTNKFQHLNTGVKQKKTFKTIQHTDRASKKLANGITPDDVKVSIKSLSANPIKWSSTLSNNLSAKLPANCLSVFDHFSGWCLNG